MKLVKGLWGVFISSRRQGLEIRVSFSGEPKLRYYKLLYVIYIFFIWNVCPFLLLCNTVSDTTVAECYHKRSVGIFKKLKRRTVSITKLEQTYEQQARIFL